MRLCSMVVLMITVVGGACAFAADPTTVEELKAHFKAVAAETDSFTADFNISTNLAAMGQPAAPGMGGMDMGGKLSVKGKTMLMNIAMEMPMGDQTMTMKMQMLMKDGFMHMVMDMNGMIQAMKMDMAVMGELADTLGVPSSALNSGDMGIGMMGNPSKMLEELEKTSTLTFEGKETLDGEDVFVLTSTMKDEVIENFKKLPMLREQAETFAKGGKIYLGANDGIMRKMQMSDFMTMTLENIDLDATISDADLELNIPEGIQVIDMTEMMNGMFANIVASGDIESESGEEN